MTDEKINEEFEKYLDGEIDTKATVFGYHYETERKGSKTGYKNMAQGFYAGFRVAERLAKIEVLEKLISDYGYDIGGKAITEINRQIKELKAGN
jgi:hypothetical protein